ncbi:MAG: response regulator [Blautia sp.]|nr:response regulator [Blautia sp.]
MGKMKSKLRKKAILLVSLFLLVTNLALGAVLTLQARDTIRRQINERLLDIVKTAAAMLDGDALRKLRPEDVDTAEYQTVLKTLTYFMDNATLDYIYCVQDMGDGSFAFGIDPDPVAPAQFGAPFVYSDALYAASKGTPSVDRDDDLDRWGRFYSAFCPVWDREGEVAAIVAADFNADWYEKQIDMARLTVILACVLFMGIGIMITFILTGQYSRALDVVKKNLRVLAVDLDSLTKDSSGEACRVIANEIQTDDIQALGEHISELDHNVQYYITHSSTQANSMITAMASDYRCVYYVNLDEDSGVCYRDDPDDQDQTPMGLYFPYLERFTWYAEHFVTEKYREGFLDFIDPDHVRERLEEKPIIAYRYLAKRKSREYYEMIRMAGVRRAQERDDHMVHAIGLGLTVIDEEMRDSMAKNETLAEALALAEDASKAKTAFLSNMSHEIRTPMNAIIGLDTLALHDETISDQTRDYLEKIGGSARHLLGLINDILDMSRIESGRMVLRKEEFSLSAIIEQINTLVMSQCSDKGLTYECRMLSRADDYYIGDDTKLKEVLINILSNAIKFTEAPGSVTLSIERTAVFDDQATLRFGIKDTGVGMDKEFIPKIFEAFSQEDSSTKNKFGSTGLGMAITKNIVEMMNGSISVESEKGVGTEFSVVVTLRIAEHQQPDSKDALDVSRLRVLVVDDEEIAAEHACMLLGEAGVRSDSCRSGEEALNMIELAYLKQEPYNLVLMDWKMPQMDGVETAKRIREHYDSETTVLMLTAYNWDEIIDEALDVGIDGFLAKPLFASNVLAELERIARRSNTSLFREKKRAPLEGLRILLAEDVEINADIMMDILSMEDMETDHAENGRIALEMFTESEVGTYAAILMDVRMPEMDGLEAAAAIRTLDRPDARKIPIIALTANAFDEDVQRSLQVGMNAHLSKPVEPDLLYQTLGELIYDAQNQDILN